MITDLLDQKYKCRACGNIISKKFYDWKVERAKHPPLCKCEWNNIVNMPYSHWIKISKED